MKKNLESEMVLMQERIFSMKNNELVHLADDIRRVDNKVDKIAAENQRSHENFEKKIDDLRITIAKYSGGIAVIIVLCDWLIKIVTGK